MGSEGHGVLRCDGVRDGKGKRKWGWVWFVRAGDLDLIGIWLAWMAFAVIAAGVCLLAGTEGLVVRPRLCLS